MWKAGIAGIEEMMRALRGIGGDCGNEICANIERRDLPPFGVCVFRVSVFNEEPPFSY